MNERQQPEAQLRTVLVRYPDFEFEYRFTDQVFSVGDMLSRNGDVWVVTEVAERENGDGLVVTVDEAGVTSDQSALAAVEGMGPQAA